MIIFYTVNTDVNRKSEEKTAYIETSHGDSTCSTTKVFRSLQHSSKVDARQSLAAEKRVTYIDSVMNLTSGICDIKQIYNYR